MDRRGPIIIIEDDEDDQYMFQQAFKSLKYENEILFFGDGITALHYLIETSVKPFIIFSDINLPKLNGIELRERLHQNESLRLKSIPYLFFSTSAEQKYVIDAYSKSAQGFFTKPASFKELEDVIRTILDYWMKCVSPIYVK